MLKHMLAAAPLLAMPGQGSEPQESVQENDFEGCSGLSPRPTPHTKPTQVGAHHAPIAMCRRCGAERLAACTLRQPFTCSHCGRPTPLPLSPRPARRSADSHCGAPTCKMSPKGATNNLLALTTRETSLPTVHQKPRSTGQQRCVDHTLPLSTLSTRQKRRKQHPDEAQLQAFLRGKPGLN